MINGVIDDLRNAISADIEDVFWNSNQGRRNCLSPHGIFFQLWSNCQPGGFPPEHWENILAIPCSSDRLEGTKFNEISKVAVDSLTGDSEFFSGDLRNILRVGG